MITLLSPVTRRRRWTMLLVGVVPCVAVVAGCNARHAADDERKALSDQRLPDVVTLHAAAVEISHPPVTASSQTQASAMLPASAVVARRAPDSSPTSLPNYGPMVDGLSITAPGTGVTVHPGDVIEVSAITRNGFSPATVSVATPFEFINLHAPPYTTTITIPMTFMGDFDLQLMGFDAAWAVAAPVPVTIHVVLPPTVSLTSLSVRPARVGLYDFAAARATTVYGTFSDGYERNISSPAFGTSYEIGDMEIATVDENGVIMAIAPGETSLTVRNGAVSITVPVHVESESR